MGLGRFSCVEWPFTQQNAGNGSRRHWIQGAGGVNQSTSRFQDFKAATEKASVGSASKDMSSSERSTIRYHIYSIYHNHDYTIYGIISI